jgi:acetolactate synthase-1/2/3 large subunit
LNSPDIIVSQKWVCQVQSALKYKPQEWAILENSTKSPMHPLTVCKQIQEIFHNQKNAVFISDGGEFGQWTQASISTPNRIINGPSGAIGSSVPAAIAASIARPEATVIAMLGDGTFGFHCMEFDTAVRYNLRFVTIIGNDAKWNAEHQIQLRDYGSDRTIGCELNSSRYDLVVKALGGHGENVENSSEFAPALKRAINSDLPSCINVSINPAKAPSIKRS